MDFRYQVNYNHATQALEFSFQEEKTQKALLPLGTLLFNKFSCNLNALILHEYSCVVACIINYKQETAVHSINYSNNTACNELITDILFLRKQYAEFKQHCILISEDEFVQWKKAISAVDINNIFDHLLKNKKISLNYWGRQQTNLQGLCIKQVLESKLLDNKHKYFSLPKKIINKIEALSESNKETNQLS